MKLRTGEGLGCRVESFILKETQREKRELPDYLRVSVMCLGYTHPFIHIYRCFRHTHCSVTVVFIVMAVCTIRDTSWFVYILVIQSRGVTLEGKYSYQCMS